MKELEVKILNIDLKEMESKLKSLGAKLISKELQTNTLIDSKEKLIQNKLNSYLRIRETKSLLGDETRLTLTMKKQINREDIRENIETNVDIYNKTNMLSILNNLGYIQIEEGYKERTSYTLDNIRFDLDIWDKATYPNPYMEIEVNNEEELKDILKLLEIPKENISTKSILELRNETTLQ